MLERGQLIQLAKVTANAKSAPAAAYSFGDKNYSYNDLNDTLRAELNALVGSAQGWRENKNTVFALIEETIDDILPRKVFEQYGQFAEIKQFAQGDRPIFTQKITNASRQRAKQFITKVGLAGVYEVFKLDGKSYEVQTSAFGGAAEIGWEEFLDGRVDFAELTNIIMRGLDECVYLEIERALKASVTSLPTANVHVDTEFNEVEMNRLLSVADAYGRATIYCTFEFAATMLPAEGWISDNMKDTMWNNGYLGNYHGHQVIVLDQSFEDADNAVKVIDPSYAWIIPTGAQKPVKIALEGQTQVREWENRDWSREMQVYKKLGVGAIITNDICVYRNTQLTR